MCQQHFYSAVQNQRADNIQIILESCRVDAKTKVMTQEIAKKQCLADAQKLCKTYEQLQLLLQKHALNNSIAALVGISSGKH